MKAVLDVGQFVSTTIRPDGHPAQIIRAWRAGRFELVTSLSILSDLRRVLFYPHIRKRHQLSDEEIHEFIDSFLGSVTITPGTLTVTVVKADPTDDKVLACAEEGMVDYIVSSDKQHLLPLRTHKGIPIIPPRQFLEILQQYDGE